MTFVLGKRIHIQSLRNSFSIAEITVYNLFYGKIKDHYVFLSQNQGNH